MVIKVKHSGLTEIDMISKPRLFPTQISNSYIVLDTFIGILLSNMSFIVQSCPVCGLPVAKI